MSRPVLFGLAISEELLGDAAPVLIQGGLARAVEQASRWGFDSVEMHIRDPQAIDISHIQKTSRSCGVTVSAVGTGLEYSLNGLSLTTPDQNLRRRTVSRFKGHIDVAGVFGATVFVGLCRGVAPDPSSIADYLNRLEDSLLELIPYALNRGATLSLEPITSSMTNLLNSTEETLSFLKRPGLNTIQLLMDTHHMHYEDQDITKAFGMCTGRIDHVHISDSDRKFPGSGEIDYEAVGESLKAIAYDKAVSLEILPLPDSRTAALNGLDWMRRTWKEASDF